MKKNIYSFEVHTYAPELNKIFLNNVNVTNYFENITSELSKDYKENMRIMRKESKRNSDGKLIKYAILEYKNSCEKLISNTTQGKYNNVKEILNIINEKRKINNGKKMIIDKFVEGMAVYKEFENNVTYNLKLRIAGGSR